MTKYSWKPHDKMQPEVVEDYLTALRRLASGEWNTPQR